MTPERSLEIQQRLGSDIAMVLDHVVALPNETEQINDACQRTILWAKRSREYMLGLSGEKPAVFAIVQGGLNAELRSSCAESLVALDFDGYAIGGLSVGEPPSQMYRMLAATCPHLPIDRPRYLMGVGRPQDILEAIRRGVDMFDCVIPTRNGRNALAFTDHGPLRLRNQIHQRDSSPLEQDCPCVACGRSRGYLRHLFQSGEMLGPILLSIHNLTYYQRLLSQARTAIEINVFEDFYQQKMANWTATESHLK
jgi:queuine tRNA-ribosyltransferase